MLAGELSAADFEVEFPPPEERRGVGQDVVHVTMQIASQAEGGLIGAAAIAAVQRIVRTFRERHPGVDAEMENDDDALSPDPTGVVTPDPVTEAAQVWLTRFIDMYAGIDAGPNDPVHAVREKAQEFLDAGPTEDDPFTISEQIAAALHGESRAAALGDGWRKEQQRLK